MYGDDCRFRHDEEARGGETSGRGSSSSIDGGASRRKVRHHARNRGKAGAFRRWLMDTFGAETLRGSHLHGGGAGVGEEWGGVMDVAGGKGELAFELVNLGGVPVTVVDPRPMRLDKYVRRFRKGFYHRNQSEAMTTARRPRESVLTAPRHLRVFFHAGLFDTATTPDPDARAAAVEASWTLAHGTRWSRRGLVEVEVSDGESDGDDAEGGGEVAGDDGRARDGASGGRQAEYKRGGAPVRQRTAFAAAGAADTTSRRPVSSRVDDDDHDDESNDADAAARAPATLDAPSTAVALESLLRKCTVVIGLHTDQATDAAVDFALNAGKPFAVVPCCTYSADFPHRRRPPGPDNPRGGGAVTTHAHLVEYLLAKAPGVCKTAVLPFEGKNVVVYSLGGKAGDASLCRAIPPAEENDPGAMNGQASVPE